MNKNALKRKKLFEVYSANLENYLDHFDKKLLKYENGILTELKESSYLCPLCYQPFSIHQIFEHPSANYLTLEHNPPKTLGTQKAEILTCKKCNNNFGKDYDNVVRNLLVAESFLLNDNQMPIESNIKIDNYQISSLITRNEKGIYIQPIKKSNPRALDYLSGQIISNKPVHIRPNLTVPDWKEYSFGLLKIAYLKAFELFGYYFADMGNGMNMREVFNGNIEYPCHNNGVIDENASEQQLGVSIVREPRELRALIITQKLIFIHNGHKIEKNIPVILPIPAEEGWALLKNYANYVDKV